MLLIKLFRIGWDQLSSAKGQYSNLRPVTGTVRNHLFNDIFINFLVIAL